MKNACRSRTLVHSCTRILAFSFLAGACASKPPAPPAPTPQTNESEITLCVIDSIAPGGMMQIGAIHVHATNDTLVLQKQGRVALHDVVAGPQVLANADWISVKQPLQFTTAAGRVRFAPAGQPRASAPGRIVLLGMMRGLPVFAPLNEGSPMRAELESLAARGIDLEKALAQRPGLRRQMDKVKTLYIPTSLVGCVFQPFTRVQARRR